SRRAWSSALVSSAVSNSETTSKEASATAGVQDRVKGDHDRGPGQREAGHGGDHQQRADARGGFVELLDGGFVVGVGTVVEVVQPRLTCPHRELVEHWLAACRQLLVAERRDRVLEVVPCAAELGHHQVE